jgi:5-formyltetrahydrofolate cyclo-ligase
MRDEAKETMRQEACARRGRMNDRETLGESVCRRLLATPEYRAARQLSIYVGTADEVQTLFVLASAWRSNREVAVPCCVGGGLQLFWIRDASELRPRTLGILEPSDEVRRDPARRATVDQLDLIVVPGLAFDRRCGRLGHGKGYYDRLLRSVPAAVPVVALAFECQVFAEVPMGDHDVFVDKVLTERALYERTGKGPRSTGDGRCRANN